MPPNARISGNGPNGNPKGAPKHRRPRTHCIRRLGGDIITGGLLLLRVQQARPIQYQARRLAG